MVNMHSKYDNMYENGMNYALKCTNNHVISSINFILSFTYQMCINWGENDNSSRCPCKPYRNSPLSSLLSLVKSFEGDPTSMIV